MILQLGDQLKRGKITEDELIAAFMAAEKLGHGQASVRMAEFIKAYRALQDPDGEHAEPLLDEFDRGASYGRAVGTVQDLRELDRTQADYDSEFARIIAHAAVTAFRHVLGAGRDTMVWSTAANGTRWRRVTGSKPCSFCVMLATRSDYRSEESAMRVVGRARGYGTASYKATGQVSYGGTMARGARAGQDRRRGKRAIGETYHDRCTCTCVEVVGEQDLTEQELAQRELYQRAAEQCDADGVPRTAKNVQERMRALDDGSVIHDARKPETATGGAGGGSKPPIPLRFGSSDDPGRVELNYKGELGFLDDWVAPRDVLRSHIAPMDDPYRYYLPPEVATADWIEKRFGIATRSIRERQGKGVKNADSWVDADRRTLEIKNPETASYLSLRDHIVKGSRQSERVVVKAAVPYPQEVAEGALGEALTQAGAHLEAVIIEIEGGGYLVWQR